MQQHLVEPVFSADGEIIKLKTSSSTKCARARLKANHAPFLSERFSHLVDIIRTGEYLKLDKGVKAGLLGMLLGETRAMVRPEQQRAAGDLLSASVDIFEHEEKLKEMAALTEAKTILKKKRPS